MFDGVSSDQFHQFIASRTSLPLHPTTFPFHTPEAPNTFPPALDPNYQLQPINLLHPLHPHRLSPPPTQHKHEQERKEQDNMVLASNNSEIQTQTPPQVLPPELIDSSLSSWTNDEVLALFRIRSSMETWFPDFTWEHVSRKLGEHGFKRSAEKCKEKFEEESGYLNNFNYNKNFRFLSDLEELYNTNDQLEKPISDHEEEEKYRMMSSAEKSVAADQNPRIDNANKRKRHDGKFEMFKSFCESIVSKMTAQQEEMHNKLIEDMVKRDEEKLAREEAWKKQEMERMNKELEIMAHEQAIAGDRQATIIEFLNKFASSSAGKVSDQQLVPISSSLLNSHITSFQDIINLAPVPSPTSSTVISTSLQNPSTIVPLSCDDDHQAMVVENSIVNLAPDSQNQPTCIEQHNDDDYNNNNNAKSSNNGFVKEDIGRRWPRDEVLALINLRCSMYNKIGEEKEGTILIKAPLWERISQGMLEMGYKRSAKRCKEKWENINKYFRKTKDVKKKRSIDSRTCPYFHQLSTLYRHGKLVPLSERLEKEQVDTDTTAKAKQIDNEEEAETHELDCSNHQGGTSTTASTEGERSPIQVPPNFSFEL